MRARGVRPFVGGGDQDPVVPVPDPLPPDPPPEPESVEVDPPLDVEPVDVEPPVPLSELLDPDELVPAEAASPEPLDDDDDDPLDVPEPDRLSVL